MFAVIFDMDGVLVNSEVYWRQVEGDFLKGLVPSWSEADQRNILGMSLYDVHRLLVEKYAIRLTAEEYIQYYRSLANEVYGKQVSLLPGVLELITEFASLKLPLAVASSSPKEWIRIVVERFGLEHFFSAIVSADDVGGIGKPAPDIYLYAVKELNKEPGHCAAIEDSRKGVLSAKGAGMKCIGIRNGENAHQDLSSADLILEDMSATSAKHILHHLAFL